MQIFEKVIVLRLPLVKMLFVVIFLCFYEYAVVYFYIQMRL